MGRMFTILLAAFSMTGVWSMRSALGRLDAGARAGKELLYLPNGKHLEVASLGHASLVADLVYLWAIQYYSDYAREDRYRYVEHVFGNVIAELDPHYLDPYWLGAMILTVEAGDLQAGLRLLDRGFEKNPNAWILPYLAGWECFRGGSLARAAEYFEKAARVEGAPPLVLRVRAGIVARAGDTREAIGMWREIRDDPRGDAGARAIAERQIRDLEVRLHQDELVSAIDAFRAAHGRYPRGLEELVGAGFVGALPLDPDGNPYAYDRRTGRVSSAAGRILGASS